MHSAVLHVIIVNLSVGLVFLFVSPSVTLVDWAHDSTYTIMISSPYGSPIILVFWCQISFSHSNGMTFKFKVKYKWGWQKLVFSIKTACISETVKLL